MGQGGSSSCSRASAHQVSGTFSALSFCPHSHQHWWVLCGRFQLWRQPTFKYLSHVPDPCRWLASLQRRGSIARDALLPPSASTISATAAAAATTPAAGFAGQFNLEMNAAGAALYLVDACGIGAAAGVDAGASGAAAGGGAAGGGVLHMLALNLDSYMTYKLQVRLEELLCCDLEIRAMNAKAAAMYGCNTNRDVRLPHKPL